VTSLHRIAKQTFSSFHLGQCSYFIFFYLFITLYSVFINKRINYSNHADIKEVRGVGLKLSRLELAKPSRKGMLYSPDLVVTKLIGFISVAFFLVLLSEWNIVPG
jgi:hypothetical protein